MTDRTKTDSYIITIRKKTVEDTGNSKLIILYIIMPILLCYL